MVKSHSQSAKRKFYDTKRKFYDTKFERKGSFMIQNFLKKKFINQNFFFVCYNFFENEKKGNTMQNKKELENRELVELKNGFTRNTALIDNKFVNAKHNLGALEQKIFFQCLTLINHSTEHNDIDLKIYTMNVKDFISKIGASSTNRDDLKKTLRGLARQVFEIDDCDNGNYSVYPIFGMLSYEHKSQMVKIAFNDLVKPYLLNFKRYLKIKSPIINSFESKYAIRFYIYLKNYRKMSYRDFDIELLNYMLQLPKSYENYNKLYKYVIYPAIKEINEKSDLNVSEPEIITKKGKKIVKFRLYFENKSQQIANEIVKELIARFKKFKSFNVFLGCFYHFNNENYEITEIKTHRNTYFEVINKGNTLFATPNRDNFIENLANNIYSAGLWQYEHEKKETLPLAEWQNEQDKLAKIRAIMQEWTEK